MITITVKKRNGNYLEFVSKGHAGYAEEGQDIVCAAVSVLVINTVNSLETFTDDQFEVQEDDGYVSFHFTAPVTEKGSPLSNRFSSIPFYARLDSKGKRGEQTDTRLLQRQPPSYLR